MTRVIDKVAWIHIVDKQILSTRSQGKDTYYFPGGKREVDETDQGCLLREIKEELDVELVPATLKYLGQFEAQAHGQHEGVRVTMTCYTGTYSGTLKASSEIEEIAWLWYEDKFKSSPVDQIIFDWLKDQDLIA